MNQHVCPTRVKRHGVWWEQLDSGTRQTWAVILPALGCPLANYFIFLSISFLKCRWHILAHLLVIVRKAAKVVTFGELKGIRQMDSFSFKATGP